MLQGKDTDDADILSMHLLSTDLLATLLNTFVVEVREFILSSGKKTSDIKLLESVMHLFTHTRDFGLRMHCVTIFKALLTTYPNDVKNDDFLNLFYANFATGMFAPLHELAKYQDTETPGTSLVYVPY